MNVFEEGFGLIDVAFMTLISKSCPKSHGPTPASSTGVKGSNDVFFSADFTMAFYGFSTLFYDFPLLSNDFLYVFLGCFVRFQFFFPQGF